jgi:regulator of sirC expression with transglutaminase-like and TPR domain
MGAAPNYLTKLLEGTHERMGLALAALSLGKESDPSVDVTGCMDRMVTLASEICEHLPASPATGDVLYTLNTHLFDKLKYPPLMAEESGKGPFIHSLLDERQGEAISFVIFYLTLGRLLHLPLEGVSFSGRLLLRVADGYDEDVIDPCAGGVILTRAELKNLFEDAVGCAVASQPRFRNYLGKMDDRDILIRLLRRYKVFHMARHHYAEALAVVEAILQITPNDGAELLEQARILEAMADTEAAAAAYFHYLERHPGSPDTPMLRQRLRWLLGKQNVLH